MICGDFYHYAFLIFWLFFSTTAAKPRTFCPMGCECDTPGVVSCITTRLARLPLRLPQGTKYFYAEHNRFMTPVLSYRNFTNYIGSTGRSAIQGMSLHNCSLTMVGFRTFTSLKSLQELDLSNNKITVIEDNTFNGLNLRMLDLSYNMGIQFARQAFGGCTIRRLTLRAVGLKTFDLTTFSFILPSLVSLSLPDNRLLTIDYRLFSCAPNLTTLYLARNPWWCGGDCLTLKLINYISHHVGQMVMDQPPVCQPGYEEQIDPALNKEKCQAEIAKIVENNNVLPPCPIKVLQPTQNTGRSITSPESSSFEDIGTPAFFTWDNGVVANYTKPVTVAPETGLSQGGDVTGSCYRLSTVVAASTMASVITLIVVLSSCLCIRACYLRCQPHRNADAIANGQTSNGLYNNNNNNNNGSAKNGFGASNGHHKNGTIDYKPILRGNGQTPQTNGNGISVMSSHGQPLLLPSSSDSSNGSHLTHSGRTNRGMLP